jgi:hypothetical protein
MGAVISNKELFGQVHGIIKGKYKTIEECRKVVNLSTLDSLNDKQLDQTMGFLYSEISTENPLHPFIDDSMDKIETISSRIEKARFLVPIVEQVKNNLGIYSEYDFHIRLISYLAYREVKGGK